jgi:multidrug efflux pump subunit AcrB
VAASVLISLLLARALGPVLAVYWLKPTPRRSSPTPAPSISAFERGYCNLLAWSLKHRSAIVVLAILSFAGGVALIPLIPKGFIPKLDRGEFNVIYSAPLPPLPTPAQDTGGGQGDLSSIPPNLAQLTPDQQALARQAQANPTDEAQPPVNPLDFLLQDSRETALTLEETILQMPDTESVLTTIGLRGEPNRGRFYVRLKPDRLFTTSEIQDQLRSMLPQQAGVTTSIEDIQFIEVEGSKPLQLVLVGDDLETLRRAAQAAREAVAVLPGIVDVTLTGAEAAGDPLPTLTRLNGRRVVTLSANLGQGQVLGEATDVTRQAVEAILPGGVTLELEGDSKLSNSVFSSFGGTLTLSVICMMIMLFIPFGRLLEPAVVGLSLPLAIVGAMLALLITQSDFGMISLIGFIFLLGLLDKNALLIMDSANQMRRAGMDRTQALLKTGLVRLRPILMTTASTILGMMPIALGLGAGAELRQPMAVAIIGGLTTSSLLSLIVVPVLYTLLEDWWQGIRRLGSSPKRIQS